MSSNLKVNTILPSTGTAIGIGTASGNVDVLGHTNLNNVSVAGVTTFAGNIDANGDLDVDGHTNLDNVNISGISSTGNIYITTGGDGRKLSFAGDGSSHYVKMDHTLNGPIINGYGGIAFETNGTNERLRIKSDGKIQFASATDNILHTSSNSSRLRLFGGSSESVNNGAVLTLHGVSHSGGNYADLAAATGGHIQFRIGTSEKLRITSDGRIGINDSSPANYELDIQKRSGVTDANIRLYNNDTTAASDTIMRFQIAGTTANNYIYFGDSGDANAGQIRYNHNGNFMSIAVNAAERMRIHSNGAITKPDNPAAMVFQCTGPSGGAANASGDNKDPLHFDHVHFNRGMTISQNNARIQVPTTGIYFVSFMVSGTCTASDEDDGIELLLLRNGSEYPSSNSGAEPVFNFGRISGNSEYACNNVLLVSLSANDYVECALDNIGSSDATVTRGNFCVMLMG